MRPIKKKHRQADEDLGRSRGGYSSKVHVTVDALGNSRRVRLTGGQVHDLQMAIDLIENEQSGAVVADKAYDSDLFIAFIEQAGAQAVIPPKANRREQWAYDENLYADRNKVERFFNRLKHYRRLATRYEKTARNFLVFWHLACCVMLTL
jgi:putative transposase